MSRRKIKIKMPFHVSITVFVLGIFMISSCEKAYYVEPQEPFIIEIPQGFPNMPFPEDNVITKSRWELGKKLFYDPILSVDSSISCASCHKLDLAFADDVAFSPGVFNRPGTRNAPSLANVGYHPYFLREGGVSSLEMQALVPIQEENEFNHNIVEIYYELEKIPEYVQMSNAAYNRPPDPFVITRALATFQRSLISGNSNYDQWNQGDESALTAQQKRGKDLFFDEKTKCSTCHGGFNFTDYSFQNNGLYEEYNDQGRYRLTRDENDKARFKVPSLRNVALTAPYMHDGSLTTLEEVIDHYNSGGENHPNKSEDITALNLTTQEKNDLVSFLESLTDYSFINNSTYAQ